MKDRENQVVLVTGTMIHNEPKATQVNLAESRDEPWQLRLALWQHREELIPESRTTHGNIALT